VSAVPDVHAGASADAELAAALTRELEGEVAFDEYTRHLYARDASMYSIMPRGVVAPRHADDVAAAVALAAEHGVPVLPRGAGTSLAGQTVGAALVLDLSRHMSRILELDPAARTARVQPGVVQDQLNRAAAEHGLMFGPDTSTSNRATLGGMIGNNSAGSGSVRYGMTIDHVLALDVVLSDASRSVFGPLTGEEEQLVVNVAKGGQVYLNDTAMTPEQLKEKLRAIVAARPDRQLYVRADQAVPYGQVMQVMGAVRDAGLVRVGLVTEPPPDRRR